MYELRADGLSWPKIATRLTELGHKPRPYVRGGEQVQGEWRHQAVRDIVVSETYLGVAHNGTKRKTGAHPAIVTPELWAKANAVKGVKPVGPNGGYALTGLVRCSSCGRVMSHTKAKGRGYFKCLDQSPQRCPGPVSIPEEPLTEWVADQFKAEYLGTRFGAEEADATVTAAAERVEAAAARLETAVKVEIRLAAGGSARAIEIAKVAFAEAEAELLEAERVLAEANAAAAGVSLPAWLDAEAFDSLPTAEAEPVARRRLRVRRRPEGSGVARADQRAGEARPGR